MITYNIYIDNELAIPINIDTSDKTEDYIQAWDKFINLLPFTPQVIEYTSLGYTPQLEDSWNGSNFVSKTGSQFYNIETNTVNMRYFALIVNGKVKWIYVLQDNEENEGLIAALLSEPTFKVD